MQENNSSTKLTIINPDDKNIPDDDRKHGLIIIRLLQQFLDLLINVKSVQFRKIQILFYFVIFADAKSLPHNNT